ncbi:prephenate dehydratase [Trapelia coarctata]|nr:prephenate dehydratase [Trapelia coarctata]
MSGDATPTPETPRPMRPRVQPLKDIRHIRRLLSHPQAFGQCEAFLSTYLKGVERQDVSSTSKAAEIVSRDPTGATAAISSKVAAQVHDLDVLAKGIEDQDDNTTRFFFLCRGPYNEVSVGSDAQQERESDQSWKTLVAFTIDHHAPGALADALMVFKTYNLNLTSINSRPSRLSPWHYIFFVEFVGRKAPNGHGPVNEAFAELKATTVDCRWYGSWINRLKR